MPHRSTQPTTPPTSGPASGFDQPGVPEPLLRALADRGYDTPTPVQRSVLERAADDRDLLVSSQTGSGKTVAFGLLIGHVLAAPGGAAAGEDRRRKGARPRALVVAPTRELANQVRGELAWLFAATGSQVASFTGGTDVGRDARTLRAGVDIVVGTPGRLVDLLTRKSLALDQVQVVVLDEADEMLDMGFREDLETILGAAPGQRRTHLFSATLPPPIVALARRYQSDPLSIDPRGGAGAVGTKAGRGHGGPAPHEDIRTIMHLVAGGDRLAAVVNVLRAAGDSQALVFCSRRDRVAELAAELVRRGFEAVGLSGEMAQGERNRSLGALREGHARVLVATDVAARGLDLPALDLVIHADLPHDAEVMLHRSGRTGRAGRKGTSVIVAESGERHRAERILRTGRVPVQWTPPPDADEIARADRERILAAIAAEAAKFGDATAIQTADQSRSGAAFGQSKSAAAFGQSKPAAAFGQSKPAGIAPDGAEADETLLALADRLLAHASPRALAAVLVAREQARLPETARLRKVEIRPARAADIGPAVPAEGRARAEFARAGAVLFSINLGSERARADPRWILPLICRRGGVTRREVGAIRIGREFTTFEIAAAAAPAFAAAAAERDPRAPQVTIRQWQGPAPRRGAPGARPPPRPGSGGAAPARTQARPAPGHPRAEAGGSAPRRKPAARPPGKKSFGSKHASPFKKRR